MSDATASADVGSPGRTRPSSVPPDVPGEEALPGDPDEAADPPAARGLSVGRLLGRGGAASVWLVTDDRGQRFALKVAERPGTRREAVVPAVERPGAGGHGRRAAYVATGGSSPGRKAPRDPRSLPDPRERVSGQEGPLSCRDAVGLQDIERELLLLQRFTHEHLLRVHRIVDTDRGPGMLMDLAVGGTLLGLVRTRGPLPIPEVVTALVPVGQALGHLHRSGALHGDVTPGNILFTNEGKPLLGDFGTARLLGAEPAAVGGTAGFVDPARNGTYDAGADVFALAAVAWFALTGRVPGPTDQRPPLALIVPDVPATLMHLIEDGLSSSRDRRPSADDFARALLASSAPGPLNLVPAVHTSVLPELLTRRAVAAPITPPSGWRRLIPTRGSTRWGTESDPRPRGSADRPTSSRRRESRRAPTVGSRAGGRTRPDGWRARSSLALAAGLAAISLLVAGIALTLGSPEDLVGGQTGQGDLDSAAKAEVELGAGAEADVDAKAIPRDRSEGGSWSGAAGSRSEVGSRAAADGRGEATGQQPGSTGASPRGDPVVALGELAALRARAFATADAALLASVDVEGSPALAADHSAVTALAESGRSLQNLSITMRNPSVLTEADLSEMPAVATLASVAHPPAVAEVSVIRATAELSSYTETATVQPDQPSPEGSAPVTPTAAGQQELIFILWDSGEGWRIHSVLPPPP